MGDVLPMLERPVYTYREVDRLLGLNQDTAKRWINGYRRGGPGTGAVSKVISPSDREGELEAA